MPKLFDLRSGRAIGTISGEDLAYLRSRLEEDRTGDTDYYLTRETLEGFRGEGGEPPKRLYQLLSIAMGPDDEMDLGVSDADPGKPCRLLGRVVDSEGPCAAHQVVAYARDTRPDNLLGAVITEADGRFLVTYDDVSEPGEGPPDLVLVVSRWEADAFVELTRLRLEPGSDAERDVGDIGV